jgi:hypothetical protein
MCAVCTFRMYAVCMLYVCCMYAVCMPFVCCMYAVCLLAAHSTAANLRFHRHGDHVKLLVVLGLLAVQHSKGTRHGANNHSVHQNTDEDDQGSE